MGKKCQRKRTSTSRYQKKSSYCTRKIKKSLEKTKKTSEGLTCEKILKLTKCLPRFIGCFSEKTLSSLKLLSKPVYLMVHVGEQVGHWIAVGVFDDLIEIFDPLGFEIFNWPTIPCHFLNFIYTLSTNKKLLLSGKVQPNTSNLCGFYCLLYLYKRHSCSFSKIQSLFGKPSKNDKLLSKLF